MNKNIILVLLFLICLTHEGLSARPEYSLRIRTNRCTTCHSNPAGGGHRNLIGKSFGPKSAPLKSFSKQDIFGFDLRSIAYTPITKNTKKHKSGAGIMAAIPSISVPFNSTEEGREWRLVYSQSIGGFGGFTTPRDAYLRVKLYDDYRFSPQFISVGRLSSPFGIVTDEHRTYVRQQTGTSWNDYEMSVLLSGDWSYALHYDIAMVNGQQKGGKNLGDNLIYEWGGSINLRYMTPWRWMIGTSASAHQCFSFKTLKLGEENCSAALSAYQALSLESLTNDWLSGVFLAEVVAGYNTNSKLQGKSFVSNLDYLNTVLDNKMSVGSLLQLNYNFQPDWTFIVKYDFLTLDWEYRKDAYYRLGFGLRHFFNNQTSLQARYEKAIVTPVDEQNSETLGLAAQDVLWVLLQIKI